MRNVILTIVLILLLSSCTKIESYDVKLNEGIDIINEGDTWVDGGCDITINGELFTMELSNVPDMSSFGEYDLVYTYSYSNQDFTCTRIVKVLDSTYPVVILNPGLDTIYKGETRIDAGITVTNNLEDEYTIITTDEVDTSNTGSYTITYEVTDYDGNQTTITRIVNITSK